MSIRSTRKDKIKVEKRKKRKGLAARLFYSDLFSSLVSLCSLSRGGNGFCLSSLFTSLSLADFNSFVFVVGVP
jgi:hypothetical protein